MTQATTTSTAGPTTLRQTSLSPMRLSMLRLWENKLAMTGLVTLLLAFSLVILAPVVATHDPMAMDYSAVLKPPSAAHLFGTDDLGRDIFSRVFYGGRESLRVGFLGISIALVGGLIFGIISGYFGSWVDLLIQRIVEVFLAFPTILLLLSIIAALGPGLTTVLIALGVSSIPRYIRLIRGSVLAVKNMEYITSARVIGATNSRIMSKHILPNILGVMVVYTAVGFGGAIMVTAGLSYIGLGAQPPSPEWGAMLNYGRSFMRTAWWMSIFPGLAVTLVVMSINLLGDGLRDAFDPRSK